MTVNVHNTRDIDVLAGALIDLMSFFASPQRDDALLREARIDLDRALFPLLVRLGMTGSLAVGDLAEQVGRDHSTVSRQLAKLASLGLVTRDKDSDRRRNAARLTIAGEQVVASIAGARRRLLQHALAEWKAGDVIALADLNQRFANTLSAFARQR